MSYDPTLIAPYKSGLKKYYKPFLEGNDAFEELDNCYSSRGVIKKREGSTIIARVPRWRAITAITNASPPVVTAAAHNLNDGDMVSLDNVVMTNGTISGVTVGSPTVVTVAGAPGISVGQFVVLNGVVGISILGSDTPFNGTSFAVTAVGANTITLSVTTIGAYVSGGVVWLSNLNDKVFNITVLTPNTFSLQDIDTNGNVAASGASVSADLYLPIMGTRIYIDSAQNERLIVFTERKAYQLDTSTIPNTFVDISFDRAAAAIDWAGGKDDYFYSSNYAGSLWVTNNVYNEVTPTQAVGIRIFNGVLNQGWQDFEPNILSGGGTTLKSALIILPYKGYMVTLNTTEGAGFTKFVNRARWSQLGTPYYQATPPVQFGTDINAWVTDIVGKGGFTDADTNESIVSAEIIQDTLIVGFQFSTWRLRFTGNFIQPFIWERINTQFGCEATYSSVAFDDAVLMISRRGIVASTFNDVKRIDLAIPDFCDAFENGDNLEGLKRIHGVRDYQKRLIYWLYGSAGSNSRVPNKILCFNYQDNTWSTFTQSFTTLASYKLTTGDNTWQTWTSTWENDNTTWDTVLNQSSTPIIVAGDVFGNVWNIMDTDANDDNGVNYNFTLTTTPINPYFDQGKRCKLAYYDLYVTATPNGQVTLQNFIDDSPSDSTNPWLFKTVDTNDQALSLNPTKTVKYIRVFLGQIARNHQIKIILTPEQLNDSLIGKSNFELQGIIFHTREEGRIKN